MLSDTPTGARAVTIAMTLTGKAHARTGKESCTCSKSKPHPVLRQVMNIPPILSKSFLFTSTLLCICFLHPYWVEKLTCELGSPSPSFGRCVGTAVVGCRLSCSAACGIFWGQGSNQCLLYCKTDS